MSNLNEKLEQAVKEYQEFEQRLTQVDNAKIELEKALEQTRGKVAAFQELIQEEQAAEVEIVDAEPEVVDTDVVEEEQPKARGPRTKKSE